MTRNKEVPTFFGEVQRKNTSKENEYGINATFLPGHFKKKHLF